jgi:hypothetical protein
VGADAEEGGIEGGRGDGHGWWESRKEAWASPGADERVEEFLPDRSRALLVRGRRGGVASSAELHDQAMAVCGFD